MTTKALASSRELSSAAVAALYSKVTRRIILMNVFSGIGSAVWLAALGEWSVLGQGLALGLLVTASLWAALSRCARDIRLWLVVTKRGWLILALPLWVLLQLAAIGLVTVFYAIIFHGGAVQSEADEFWPRLLWSYALASGSLISVGSIGEADRPAIKVCTAFFGQLAFVPAIIAVVFFKPTLNQLMMIFGSAMIASCLVQLADYVRTFPSRSA